MPITVTERDVELFAPTVVPVPLTHSNADSLRFYPRARLCLGSRRQPQTFRLVCLEGEHVKVEICPDLGGRIVGLRLLGHDLDFFKIPDSLEALETDQAELDWHHGIDWTFGGGSMSGLDSVEYHVEEAEEARGPVGLVLSGRTRQRGHLFRHLVGLVPGEAALQLESQVYLEGTVPRTMATGFRVFGKRAGDRSSHLAPGVSVSWSGDSFEVDTKSDWTQCSFPSRSGVQRIPGTVLSWSARLYPVPWNVSDRVVVARGGVADLVGSRLKVFPLRTMTDEDHEVTHGLKLRLNALAGVLNEAVFPEESQAPRALWGHTFGEREVRRADVGSIHFPSDLLEAAQELAAGDAPGAPLRSVLPGTESWSHLLRIRSSIRASDYVSAFTELRTMLEINPMDHRAWWLNAALHRQTGGEDPSDSLMVAHGLWPEEPLLRAEAFLASPVMEGSEPSPLLAHFKDQVDDAVDVGHELCALSFDQDLSRFADEVLRHVEIPLLRYLWAYALLERSRFHMHAAELVGAAARAPFVPPFADRPLERKAIRTLSARFPNDGRLQLYLALLEAAPGTSSSATPPPPTTMREE